ncbi:DUF1559 domain-containing protein [Planctomicrobium sp. SH661]|uniref:DUF1559 family PulG-like putative transporter n=1 Tax=Planctomicrobium sp. SH661 TaxID=3448124 RepID=UPI003F5C5C70
MQENSFNGRQPPRVCRGELRGRLAKRSGFTILELLTCIGIISVLISILLPALGATRESARRLQCHNHLKQLGIALHSYHEVNQCLPPAWRWDLARQTAYGWLPPLLPYLEQPALSQLIDFESAVDSAKNQTARTSTLPLFLCPSDLSERTFMLYSESETEGTPGDIPLFRLPAANYVGVFGVLEPDDVWKSKSGVGAFAGVRPVRFEEFTRGLSNVLLVGERRASTIPSTWLGVDERGEDAACRILGNANLGPNIQNADECEFTSRHRGVTNFLWGDGHVHGIADSIDPRLYREMAARGEF